jgi:ribosomal protein S27E
MGAEETHPAQEGIATFPCPGCGGQMLFDVVSQSLKCKYCGNEKVIENDTDQPNEHELIFSDEAAVSEDLKDWGMEQQTIKCESCSSEMLIPVSQTAAVCAFCGSAKVLPQGDAGSIRPESILPFQISQQDAVEAFQRWKKKRWFVPNEFKKRSTKSLITGVYIPFWTFDSETSSAYTAEVGIYHYRTETRTRTVNGKSQTYTETVRYTVWHWTNGNYNLFFNDVLIPASIYDEGALLERMDDYQLEKLAPYKPEYLSGYIAQRYTVPIKDGWVSAKTEIKNTLTHNIKQVIGGNEIRSLNINTSYSDQKYKHILLPVWNATYKYKDKIYRYVVSGETSSVYGNVPRSAWKITFLVLMCLALIAVIFFVVNQNA